MRKYFEINIYLGIYLRTLYAFKQVVFLSLNKVKQYAIIKRKSSKCIIKAPVI